MKKTVLFLLPFIISGAGVTQAAPPSQNAELFSPTLTINPDSNAARGLRRSITEAGARITNTDKAGHVVSVTGTAEAVSRAEKLISVADVPKQVDIRIYDTYVKPADKAQAAAIAGMPSVSVTEDRALPAGSVTNAGNYLVSTLNGMTVPWQLANTRGYVESVSVTAASTTSGSNTELTPRTTITPGSVTTGISMTLKPLAENNGDVTLHYKVNSSVLRGRTDGFDVFTSSDGISIQLPNISSQTVDSFIRIPEGKSVLLKMETSDTGVHFITLSAVSKTVSAETAAMFMLNNRTVSASAREYKETKENASAFSASSAQSASKATDITGKASR